jgi:hypothetical protein
LARLKLSTMVEYFWGRVFIEIGGYRVNTKSSLIPTSIGEKNTRQINKA